MKRSRQAGAAQTKIAVIQNFAFKAARELTSGILRYAARKPDWEVRILGAHPANEDSSFREDWQADGIITGVSLSELRHSANVDIRKPKAAVFTCIEGFSRSMAFTAAEFVSDDRGIARAAANLLIRHGLRNFAYVGSRRPQTWSDARARHFSATVGRKGFHTLVYEPPKRNPTASDERDSLAKWLLSLPKPCGIFVAYDQRAKHILDICRDIGIPIPEQVQILSVDNEDWLCECTSPTLSSILPDFENGGFSAAMALDAMLRGKRYRVRSQIGVRSVIERMSTTDLHGSGNRVSRAREYIRLHACDGITVEQVARAVGGSTRLLESSFRQVSGSTVRDEIAAIRLDKATDLLLNSRMPIEEIAHHCGFGSSANLKRRFKSRYGMTMREFRQGGFR